MHLEFCLYSRKPGKSEQRGVDLESMFIILATERVPRRLTIHTLIAIGVCISVLGCKGFKSIGGSFSDPKAGATQNSPLPPESFRHVTPAKPVVKKPSGTSQGKVMLVDQALGFCVVDFVFAAQMPSSEQRYFVYRGNQQVGEILTTAQTDESFLVADINKGDIREGDSVRSE